MTPGNAHGVVQQVKASWEPFFALVERLGPSGIERRTASGWTAKEMLGHVAFWEEAVVGAVTAMFRNQPMPEGWAFGSGYTPDPGEWPRAEEHNAREAAWARGRTPGTVLQRLRTAHADMVTLLAGVTDDEIREHSDYFAALGSHYREHLPELAALLDQ